MHRENRPAVEYPDGYKEWYDNGFRHRKEGPAIEWSNGATSLYFNNKFYGDNNFTNESWKRFIKTLIFI